MHLYRINGDLIDEGKTLIEIINNNRSNLSGANFTEADLTEIDLTEIDLTGAIFFKANLNGADFTRSNLTGAIFFGANFTGSKRWQWNIKSHPIMISGLKYRVMIFNEHMEIGREQHSFKSWSGFSDREILNMDGKSALDFWNENASALLSYCKIQSNI